MRHAQRLVLQRAKVPRMAWRSKRSGHRAEQMLAGATVATVSSDEGSHAAGVSAVRAVLARAELEREIGSVAIVALDNMSLAEELGAALGVDRSVDVVRIEAVRLDEVDAAIAVVSATMPAQAVVDALGKLDSILLGVVRASDPGGQSTVQPANREKDPAESDDAASEALADLERAAGTPSPASVDRPASGDDELSRRLAELTHREVALRKITEAVERQRTQLEERERALDRADSSLEALVERAELAEGRAERAEQLADRAEQRATDAHRRSEEAEEKVRELTERVAELEALVAAQRREIVEQLDVIRPIELEQLAPLMPEAEAPVDDGRYTLQRLEQLIRDAQLTNEPHAEEWTYYLRLLREHADAVGRLPIEFHALIDSVFGGA